MPTAAEFCKDVLTPVSFVLELEMRKRRLRPRWRQKSEAERFTGGGRKHSAEAAQYLQQENASLQVSEAWISMASISIMAFNGYTS